MKKATVLPLRGKTDGTIDVALQGEDGAVSLGNLRPLVEGAPIHDLSGLCEVADRKGTPFYDATFPFAKPDEPSAAPVATGHNGPAKVNSKAYRDAWERIFGPKAEA